MAATRITDAHTTGGSPSFDLNPAFAFHAPARCAATCLRQALAHAHTALELD